MEKDIVERLEEVAQGRAEPVYPFSANDWRVGSLALLIWDAAQEIRHLRQTSGAVSRGPSYSQIAKDARHDLPVTDSGNG